MSEPFNVLCETRHGPMLVNKNDIYVGGSIIAYGEFSRGEADLFAQLVKPGMPVINAGANIGAHAIRLAQLCAPAICHAFEPQLGCYELLIANKQLNSLVNLLGVYAAVGATLGEIKVPVLQPTARNNFGGLELNAEHPMGPERGGSALPVPMMPIDALGLPSLGFLMADCEGMELDVLRGAQETIERCLPTLYIEADREAQRAGLLSFLTETGYAAYWHTPPLYHPENFKNNPENLFPNVVSINWLCVPMEHTLHESWHRVTAEAL